MILAQKGKPGRTRSHDDRSQTPTSIHTRTRLCQPPRDESRDTLHFTLHITKLDESLSRRQGHGDMQTCILVLPPIRLPFGRHFPLEMLRFRFSPHMRPSPSPPQQPHRDLIRTSQSSRAQQNLSSHTLTWAAPWLPAFPRRLQISRRCHCRLWRPRPWFG